MRLDATVEIAASQLISVDHSLQHAIAQSSKTKLLRAIASLANPYIGALNVRFAALISHEFPDSDGGSLLANALAAAADAYASCAEDGGRLEENEAAYVSALVAHGARIADYTVHGVKGQCTERWPPFSQPLGTWAVEGQFSRLIFTPRSGRDLERRAAMVFLIGSLLSYDRAELVTDLVLKTGNRKGEAVCG